MDGKKSAAGGLGYLTCGKRGRKRYRSNPRFIGGSQWGSKEILRSIELSALKIVISGSTRWSGKRTISGSIEGFHSAEDLTRNESPSFQSGNACCEESGICDVAVAAKLKNNKKIILLCKAGAPPHRSPRALAALCRLDCGDRRLMSNPSSITFTPLSITF